MRKKFAINLIILIAANLLVKPIWVLGIDRVVQNNVGPEVYGPYFAVFNYSFLFNVIIDFGVNNFNNRAISRNNKRVGEYMYNLVVIKGLLSLVYLAITFAAALPSGIEPTEMKMLFFLCLNQILLYFVLYFRSSIAALQMFKTDSVISVLDRLLSIIFCVVLIYAEPFKGGFDIMWFIYAQSVALFITMLAGALVLVGKAKINFKLWRFKFIRSILWKSAPFAMLGLMMGIYSRIGAVMIKSMLVDGGYETGVYAAGFRLLDSVNMFGYMFATLLLPLFASMIRQRQNIQPLVALSSDLLYVGSVAIGAVCFFFNKEIMLMLYPDSNAYWWSVFGWLMLTFIPIASVYVYGTLLTAYGNLKMLNSIAIAGAFFNVGLNLYMIPAYGAWGATVATLVTQGLVALAHIVVATRQFNFKIEAKEILKLSAYTIIAVAGVYAVRYVPVHWFVQMCLGGVVCGIAILALQIIPISGLMAIVKSKATS